MHATRRQAEYTRLRDEYLNASREEGETRDFLRENNSGVKKYGRLQKSSSMQKKYLCLNQVSSRNTHTQVFVVWVGPVEYSPGQRVPGGLILCVENLLNRLVDLVNMNCMKIPVEK